MKSYLPGDVRREARVYIQARGEDLWGGQHALRAWERSVPFLEADRYSELEGAVASWVKSLRRPAKENCAIFALLFGPLHRWSQP